MKSLIDATRLPPTSAARRLESILARALQREASDVHLAPGEPARVRCGGRLEPLRDARGEEELWTAAELEGLADERLSSEQRRQLAARGSVDGAFSLDDGQRLRFNVFRRSGGIGWAIRRLENRFRTLQELGLSDQFYRVCDLAHGLVIVSGPTGSGKSTTLATLVHRINESRAAHVVTIEDPIEFVHTSGRALVTQRQVGLDAPSFHQALLDALRQDPDVLLIGELRDLDTIRTAVTAAETGHLVLASVHAGDCVGAVERLVSVFPADEQRMVQRLLAMVLRAIVAQHLLPCEGGRRDGGSAEESGGRPERVLAYEQLFANSAIANLIAQGNPKQIYSVLETGAAEGMITLDASLARLYRQRRISEGAARALARHPQALVGRRPAAAAG